MDLISVLPFLLPFLTYFKFLLLVTNLTSKHLWKFNTFFIYGRYRKFLKNSSIFYLPYSPWAGVSSAIIYSKIDEVLKYMWKVNFYSRGRVYRNIISLHKEKVSLRREKVDYYSNIGCFIWSRGPSIIAILPIILIFVLYVGYFNVFGVWSLLYIIAFTLTCIGSFLMAYFSFQKEESKSYGVEERESDKLFIYLVDLFPDIRTEKINDEYDTLKFKLNDFYNSVDYLKNLKDGKRKFYTNCKDEREKIRQVQDDLCKKYEISPDYSYLYVDFIPPIVGGEYLIPKKHLLDPRRLQREVKFGERIKDYLRIWGFIWFMFILLVLILVLFIIDIYRRFFI